MTEQERAIIEFVLSLPLHGILLIGIIVLWRDNKQLREKLEQVRQVSAGNTALLLNQNNEIESIKTHVTGLTPAKGIAPILPYSTMPPYRKANTTDFRTDE
jgi:hypothetical protein